MLDKICITCAYLNRFEFHFVNYKQLNDNLLTKNCMCLCVCDLGRCNWVSNMIEYQWKTDDFVRIVDHFYTKIYLSVHLQSTTYHIDLGSPLNPFVYRLSFVFSCCSRRSVFIDVRHGGPYVSFRAPLIRHLNFSHTNFVCVDVVQLAFKRTVVCFCCASFDSRLFSRFRLSIFASYL